MKKIALVLFSLIVVLNGYAQDEYPLQRSLQPVDSLQVEVSYDVTLNYTNNHQNCTQKDKMYTLIGKNVCRSYVEREWKNQLSLTRSYEENGKRGSKATGVLYTNYGDVFINYPAGHTTVIYNMDAAGSYLYEEKTPKEMWTIGKERKTVLGYACESATCNFRGRDYKVWFSSEIPLSYGPWKLGGLPGLILEAETADSCYHFIATGLEKKKGNITFWKRDFVKSTREKTLKQEALLFKDPGSFLEPYGFTFLAKDMFTGKIIKMSCFAFYYPLEKK